MAHRNRWFTVLKNGWIFHGELLNKHMVYRLWKLWLSNKEKTGLPRASLWETGSFRPRPQLIRFVNTPETLCSKGFLLELYIIYIYIYYTHTIIYNTSPGFFCPSTFETNLHALRMIIYIHCDETWPPRFSLHFFTPHSARV